MLKARGLLAILKNDPPTKNAWMNREITSKRLPTTAQGSCMKRLLFFVGLAALLPVQAWAIEPFTLKCTTTTSGFLQSHTTGDFYLNFEPTAIASFVRFKTVSISPGHKSLIADANCSAYPCQAMISDTKYQLANAGRPKFYLTIDVDRTNGAYHAEEGVSSTDRPSARRDRDRPASSRPKTRNRRCPSRRPPVEWRQQRT